MRVRLYAAVIALTLSAQASQAFAANLTPAIGSTGQGQTTIRLGVESNWEKKFLNDRIGGYWDAGITNWDHGDKASQRQSLSFSPVFTYSLSGEDTGFYLEAGIGVGVFNGTTVGNKKIGSSVHFEDRVGAGYRFENDSKIGLRAIHYSNAGIKQPNNGIESYTLFYSIPL